MDTSADNLCEAFSETLENILVTYSLSRQRRVMPRIPDPGVPTNDLAKSCSWSSDDFVYFYDELKKLSETAKEANAATDKARTISLWQSVFHNAYPSSLTEQEEKAMAESVLQRSDSVVRPSRPYQLQISAKTGPDRNHIGNESYKSDGRKLPKNYTVQFKIECTDVPPPYDIRWVLRNHGVEARRDNGLSHQTFPGSSVQIETTKYRGHHFMDCEIVKNGMIVAKARHIINIG